MSQAWSLPPCEGSDWHNCYGTKNYEGEYKGYKYVGEWKSNKRHGQGTFTFGPGDREGDTYEGEFKYGLFHGQGTYTFRYGEYKGYKYVGEWKSNKRNGQGTYTFADGRVWEGQWSNDEWVNGKKYAAGNNPVDVKAGRIKREKKSREIEQANDNIRIALDALNYTFVGDKKERKTIVLDAENCIFENEYSNILYLNNVIVDTINFLSKNVYMDQGHEGQYWVEIRSISFSGDEKVYNNKREYEGTISSSADLERVQKAWGVIYSRACKGASAGEF